MLWWWRGRGGTPCDKTRQGVMVSMESRDDFHQSCWIELTKDISFLVLFHHYRHPSYLQMAHLGFYIADGQGLSLSTKGLLGTFIYHPSITLNGFLCLFAPDPKAPAYVMI